MTDITAKRASLWREAWKATKESAPTFWPWVAGFGLLFALLSFLMFRFGTSELMLRMQDNPQLLQQHPELMQEYLRQLPCQFLWFVPLLAIISIGYYIFTVMYLRLAALHSSLDYSIHGYFYWLGKTFCKWLRAFWILLPIIGVYFYAKAVLRYQAVSPLAVLRHGDELKTSWALTRGNWWRIFGNALVFSLILIVIVVGVVIVLMIPVFLVVFLFHLNPKSMALHILAFTAQGMVSGFMIAASSIFSCTVYRILSQEAQQAAAIPASPSPPS